LSLEPQSFAITQHQVRETDSRRERPPVGKPFDSLLRAAQGGDERAWAQLLRRVDGTLHGYMARQGGVEIDDLVSETWLQVARGLPRFAGDEKDFRAWVFTIAHHRLVDERRSRSRRIVELADRERLEDATRPSPSAETEALARLREQELETAFNTLSPDQREVFVLRFVAGFGLTEIATIMGKTPNAVRALQRRGLKRLEKTLQEEVRFSWRPSVTGAT
jgi:RNA polymerase sigma-70 factor (ECF subfamily)